MIRIEMDFPPQGIRYYGDSYEGLSNPVQQPTKPVNQQVKSERTLTRRVRRAIREEAIRFEMPQE